MSRTKTSDKSWEECYYAAPVTDDMLGDHEWLQDFKTYTNDGVRFNTVYYRTYGGGPEGGYFITYYKEQGKCQSQGTVGIYEVRRDWGQPFRIVKDYSTIGSKFEFRPGNDMKGQPMAVRVIKA